MDAPVAEREVRRRGHSPAASSRSGLHTILFFGLIVLVVGAAGVAGVTVWGPEKTVKNRTSFATNPPAPTALPSLAESAEAPPPIVAEPAPTDTPSPDISAAAPTAKKAVKKRAPKPTKH
jgi:uncharacterized iron-regulated membrane protein